MAPGGWERLTLSEAHLLLVEWERGIMPAFSFQSGTVRMANRLRWST